MNALRSVRGAAFLCVLLSALPAVPRQAVPQQAVPQHPRDLKFPSLEYVPPQRAACRHQLANGVIGYFVEDHDLPLVNVSVSIRTGSYLDPEGKTGLAFATGSQIRAGGTQHYKADQFDEEVDFLAASISSFIGATSGAASVNFLAKDADRALELFFDMLRNPGFQPDRLELYRTQQLQQIERRNDRTDDIEAREWNRLLRGPDHFTSRMTTRDSIKAITRDDLIQFHRRYYHPKNLILAVSGDFKTADMKARLEKAMAGWTGSADPVPPVPAPKFVPAPGVYLVSKPDVNQARVSMGHTGIMRGIPDEFAIDMMNDILGGSGFTSRITNRVRSDEGLAYSAGSSFSAGVYFPGQFRAAYQSKDATAAKAAQIVLDEINRIRTEKVSAEELETVKNNAIEVFPRYFASAAAVAGTFASDELTGRDPNFWNAYRDRLRAVTREDVLRVAKKYLEPSSMVILVVGNIDSILKAEQGGQYSFEKINAGKPFVRIPLPDPATMVYPEK
jgi:zinc protease